jgi:hypothetical protein
MAMKRETWQHRSTSRFALALLLGVLSPAWGCSSDDAAGSTGAVSDGGTDTSSMDGMNMGMDGMDMDSMVSCTLDPRVDAYDAGLVKTGQAGVAQIEIVSSNPAPPARDDNTWSIQLRDAAGAPLDGSVSLSLDMPDHGHLSPTTPTITAGAGAGAYTIDSINLFMPGVWRIQFNVYGAADAAAPIDVVTFYFCVEG